MVALKTYRQPYMNKKFSIKIENMKYQMSNCVKTQFCV